MGCRALICEYNNPLHDDKNLICCDGKNKTKRIMMEHSRIIEVNMSSMMKDRIIWRFFLFSFSSSIYCIYCRSQSVFFSIICFRF